MLEADEEYIALVTKHHRQEDVESWVDTGATDWNSFFCFLVKLAKHAHQVQVLHETRSGLNTVTTKKCNHCSGDHPSKFCKLNKSKQVLATRLKDLN